MTDAEITAIADECGMYECHDNGRVNGNTVLDFARAVIAAQLAAPVAAQIHDVSYEIIQDDIQVAFASGERAYAEILHYASQYEQDGPIEIFKVTREAVNNAQLAAPVAAQEPAFWYDPKDVERHKMTDYADQVVITGANVKWGSYTTPLYASQPAQGECQPDDAAMLDWLEQSAQSFCGNYSGSNFRMIGSSIWHGTLREAIAGAMKEA